MFAIPLILAVFLLLCLAVYAFPILAYFENSTKKVVKNVLLMAVAYLPYTAAILVVDAMPVLLLFMGNLLISRRK